MKNNFFILLTLAALFGINTLNAQNGTNVKTLPNLAENEQQVSMDIAFNGWVYQAFSISSGYVVVMSKDNGDTWTTIDSVVSPGYQYSVKLVVAGTDTNYLQVCLAINAFRTATGSTTLALNYLNGSTGLYTGSAIIDSYDAITRGFDIATDYKFPSVNSAPYAIGVLYVKGGGYDSLFIAVSPDSGASFGPKQLVDTSLGFIRRVSLAYGISGDFSNGRFFMAWEQFNESSDTVGHVYTTYTPNVITDQPLFKVDIDSMVSLTAYRLCNPKIATSQSTSADNDSGNITTLIVVDYIPAGAIYNTILGFDNMGSVYGSTWGSFNLVFTSQNTPQADLSYNPVDTSFMLTYYNQAMQELPYLTTNINLNTGWATRLNNYVTDSNYLVNPLPTVRVNPANNQAAFGWNNTYNGVQQAMFDAVYRLPVPVITSLSPDTVIAGNAGFVLTVNGALLQGTSNIYWAMDSLATTFINSGQLTANIPASLVLTADSLAIGVYTTTTTGGGGGFSNALEFYIVMVTSINSLGQPNTIMAYPNPANDHLNIAYAFSQADKWTSGYSTSMAAW